MLVACLICKGIAAVMALISIVIWTAFVCGALSRRVIDIITDLRFIRAVSAVSSGLLVLIIVFGVLALTC